MLAFANSTAAGEPGSSRRSQASRGTSPPRRAGRRFRCESAPVQRSGATSQQACSRSARRLCGHDRVTLLTCEDQDVQCSHGNRENRDSSIGGLHPRPDRRGEASFPCLLVAQLAFIASLCGTKLFEMAQKGVRARREAFRHISFAAKSAFGSTMRFLRGECTRTRNHLRKEMRPVRRRLVAS